MLQVVLVVLYIGLNHIAAVYGNSNLQALALSLLATAILWQGLKKGNKFIWLSFVGICLVLGCFAIFKLSIYIAFLPPIIIPLMFAIVFINSLIGNNVPLVTDIGEKSRGPLSEAMRAYTRGVTTLWAVTLVAMALWSLLLPLASSIMLWSIITNFGNYVLIAVLFLGEFVYRQYRFPDHNHPTLSDYLKIVTSAMRTRKHG